MHLDERLYFELLYIPLSRNPIRAKADIHYNSQLRDLTLLRLRDEMKSSFIKPFPYFVEDLITGY